MQGNVPPCYTPLFSPHRFAFKVNELAYCLHPEWWEIVEHLALAFHPLKEMINQVQAEACTAGNALEFALTTLQQFPDSIQNFAPAEARGAKEVIAKRLPMFM